MKRLSGIVMAILLTPLHGAVTWPSVTHYTWNFNLGTGGPSSSTSDMLTIQLDSTDRLVEPERMLIRMYAGLATEPMYSRDWNGTLSGLNGLLYTTESWDAPLAALWGRLELDIEGGSVELRRLSLSVATGTRSYSTTITPEVRLVPEPGVVFLIPVAGCLALLRRRYTGPFG